MRNAADVLLGRSRATKPTRTPLQAAVATALEQAFQATATLPPQQRAQMTALTRILPALLGSISDEQIREAMTICRTLLAQLEEVDGENQGTPPETNRAAVAGRDHGLWENHLGPGLDPGG